MKKLSLRDINMILVVVGLLILLLVYFLVYNNYKTKNEELTATLNERSQHLTELQSYYDNLKKYENGTIEGKANIKTNLGRLPLDIKSEDFLVYIMDSVKAVNGTLNSVKFNDSQMISTFNTVVNEKSTEVKGYQIQAGFSGSMTYAQLKDYLEYVYDESDNITFIDSFNVSYNAESSVLETNFDLSKYYIQYEGSEYIPVPVPDVPIGIDNPFHTK